MKNLDLNILNKFISLLYLCVVVRVALHAARNGVSLIGSATIILVAVLFAWGHFFLKIWALMASAAIAWVIVFLFLFYLISGYDVTLVSALSIRLMYFCIATMMAALLSLNYWLTQRKSRQ